MLSGSDLGIRYCTFSLPLMVTVCYTSGTKSTRNLAGDGEGDDKGVTKGMRVTLWVEEVNYDINFRYMTKLTRLTKVKKNEI